MTPDNNLLPGAVILLSALQLLTSHAVADSPDTPTLTRGPYLQLSTPSSVSIIWRTVGEFQPVLRYGLDPARLDQTLAEASILVRRVPKEGEAANELSLHSAPDGTVQFDATISGLEPDTTYYYTISNETTTLAGGDADHFFRAHPVPGKPKPVRVGYGDSDDVTVLKDMQKKYTVVYARSDFELPPGEKEKIGELDLAISCDDAFIAWLNGHEVLRVGVKEGHRAKARDVESHEVEGYEYFPWKDATQYLTVDDNILSIEAHNTDIDSSDFRLDPYLLAVPRATP